MHLPSPLYQQQHSEALAFEEDYAFLRGSGVGRLGRGEHWRSGDSDHMVSNDGINFTDVTRVFTRLLPGSYSNAIWMISRTRGRFAGPCGAGGTTPCGWAGRTGRVPLVLRHDTFGPSRLRVGEGSGYDATLDLSLADFSQYLLGDRQIIQASSSPHFKFSSDKTAYKILERVDGRPWVQTALTPRNSSATLSPYVGVGPT
jgi:hypothetical protein